MAFDPGRAAETKAWLEKAALDRRGAEVDFAAEPPLLEEVLFHSQQLVEKSLKAFLCWHDIPFRKTHNLIELGEPCAKLDHSLETLLRKAAVLTEYAWKYRYPGDVEVVEKGEAEKAFHLADNLNEEIKRRLPPSTHPGGEQGHPLSPAAHERPAVYRVKKAKGKKTRKK